MKTRLVMVFAVLSAIMATGVSAEIYKWVNADGSTGFTDDMSKVPAKYREQIKAVDPDDGTVSVMSSNPGGYEQRRSAYGRNRDDYNEMSDQDRARAEMEMKAAWDRTKSHLSQKERKAKRRADAVAAAQKKSTP